VCVTDSQSSPCAQESAVSNSGSDSLASLLALSLTWRGKHSRARVWTQRLRRVPWMTRLSGPTSRLCLDDNSLERWTSSLPDSPASRGAVLDSGRVQMTSDGSGPTSRESFARWDRDSSSWRTCQGCLLPDLDMYSETWPKAGSMRSGMCSAREPWEQGIRDSDSSSWPTAVANDDNKSPDAHMAMKHRMKGGPRNTITSLQVMTKAWPTPTGTDCKASGSAAYSTESGRHSGTTLTDATQRGKGWSTPRSSPNENRTTRHQPSVKEGKHGRNLAGDAMEFRHSPPDLQTPPLGDGCLSDGPNSLQQWQTPQTDSFRSRGGDRKDEVGLDQQARATNNWTTPGAGDVSSSTGLRKSRLETGRKTDYLCRQAAATEPGSKKKLNPRFVEWLMGFPPGWTSFEHSETEWSRWSQRMRSVLSRLGSRCS